MTVLNNNTTSFNCSSYDIGPATSLGIARQYLMACVDVCSIDN